MKKYSFRVFLLLLMLWLVACENGNNEANVNLPPLRNTDLPMPHVTPTFVPLRADFSVRAEDVDWANVDHMYAAMRPEYASDVDQFVNTQRYYIRAKIEFLTEYAVIQGSQAVRYVNNTGVTLDEIVFRLTANIENLGSHQRVENVYLNGQPVEPYYEARNTVMVIPVEGGLAPGAIADMSMDFIMVSERGVLPGRIGFASNQYQAVNWMPVLSVYDGPEEGWWRERLHGVSWDPYYNHPSLWEIELTYPANALMAISGITIERTENDDNTITERIVTGPMRDNFLMVSTNMGKISDSVDGTQINVYYMPQGERGAAWVLESAIRSLEIFNRLWGDYPYVELDVAQTETNAGGIEYSGIILVDRNVWQAGSPSTELVTAHEVAHQWWYGLVGNNQAKYPFLDESLASWSEAIYYREAYDDNNERFNNLVNGDRNALASFKFAFSGDTRMYRPSNEFGSSTALAVLIYTQGTVFYADLEKQLLTPAGRIGLNGNQPLSFPDTTLLPTRTTVVQRTYTNRQQQYDLSQADLMNMALSDYFHRMKYRMTSPVEILRSFEKVTGQDLDAFFYSYLGEFPGMDPSVLTSTNTSVTSSSFVGG